MKPYFLFSLLTGISLFAVILYMVRRDHIYVRQALFWISTAIMALLFGAFPSLMDFLAERLGIAYSPTIVLLGAAVILVVKALLSDIAMTRLNRDIRRLNQRIALLESGPCRNVPSKSDE